MCVLCHEVEHLSQTIVHGVAWWTLPIYTEIPILEMSSPLGGFPCARHAIHSLPVRFLILEPGRNVKNLKVARVMIGLGPSSSWY